VLCIRHHVQPAVLAHPSARMRAVISSSPHGRRARTSSATSGRTAAGGNSRRRAVGAQCGPRSEPHDRDDDHRRWPRTRQRTATLAIRLDPDAQAPRTAGHQRRSPTPRGTRGEVGLAHPGRPRRLPPAGMAFRRQGQLHRAALSVPRGGTRDADGQRARQHLLRPTRLGATEYEQWASYLSSLRAVP